MAVTEKKMLFPENFVNNIRPLCAYSNDELLLPTPDESPEKFNKMIGYFEKTSRSKYIDQTKQNI
jgi:hypothetical protein